METIDLKAARERAKLKQSQMAEILGVDRSTYCRWENHGIPQRGAGRAVVDKACAERPDVFAPVEAAE